MAIESSTSATAVNLKVTLDPHIGFGKVGTVTGIYKTKLEVMFDEPFIGATDLAGRCEPFRGAVVEFHSIFNLSEWKSYVNTKSKIEDKVNNLFDLKRKGY